MAGNNDRARKLLIRSAVVTGSTVATLVGVQSLFMLDQMTMGQPQAPLTQTAGITTGVQEVNSGQIANSAPQNTAPQIDIVHRAPSLVILRQAGQTGSGSVTTTTPAGAGQTVIRPPQPQEQIVQAPPPVAAQPDGGQGQVQQPPQQIIIVQEPAPAQTQSTR